MNETASESEKLLGDFSPPDMSVWRDLLESQLKGAPFDKKMKTQTPEGITLEPIYDRHSVEKLASASSLPGAFPYLRGNRSSGYRASPWMVCQELPLANPKAFNEAMLHDLNKGQRGVILKLDQAGRYGSNRLSGEPACVGEDGTSIHSLEDLTTALKGLDLAAAPIHLEGGHGGPALAGMFLALLEQRGTAAEDVSGSLGLDPLGSILETGGAPASVDRSMKVASEIAAWMRQRYPNVRTLSVDTTVYGNAGAHAVQELSVLLAGGAETMRHLLKHGLSPDDAARSIRAVLGIGPDFFREICKFRAARHLWSHIMTAFGVSEEAAGIELHAATLQWNKTLNDPYVNMLRTTTEGFSAALGGCDSMTLSPFDQLMGEPDTFSRRISRNQQTILAEEAHLNETTDPAGGSWYVETLTRQLAEAAWKDFQAIEAEGGLFAVLQTGRLQEDVAKTAEGRKKLLNQRRHVMVGSNMYANLSEKPLPERRSDSTDLMEKAKNRVPTGDCDKALKELRQSESSVESLRRAAMAGASLSEIVNALFDADEGPSIPALQPARLTEEYEDLRSRALAYAEKHGEAPIVFFANMGPVKQYKIRADFVAEFMGPSGFTLLNDASFEDPEAAAQAAVDAGAAITVICSTDDTYPDLVPPLARKAKSLNPDMQIIVAGYPEEHVDSLKKAGVDEFLHMKSNNLELLQTLQSRTGVRS